MRNYCIAGTILCVLMLASIGKAESFKQPEDHAPLGVMGDHLHEPGSWMIGYRYKRLESTGLREGTNGADVHKLLETYGEAPTQMRMDMHMIEIMYGVTPRLTLMLMPQWMRMEMTHLPHHSDHAHQHEVQGLGDTELTGLYSVWNYTEREVQHRAHLHLGMSLPTGSITERFMNHHNAVYPMPYGMQLGTGSWDPILGFTYAGNSPRWSWGMQTVNYFRIFENKREYRQGNKYTATAWGARNLNSFMSLSLRIEGEVWEQVEGKDPYLPVTAIVGADPEGQAGERIIGYLGINMLAGKKQGIFAGQRIALEMGIPVYERYSGPQLETDYRLTLGWQYSF